MLKQVLFVHCVFVHGKHVLNVFCIFQIFKLRCCFKQVTTTKKVTKHLEVTNTMARKKHITGATKKPYNFVFPNQPVCNP